MENRINIGPQVCHGQACIEGTRIPVHRILQMLANGDTIEDLFREYPSVTRQDILACFDYAALLAEEQGTPLEVLSGEGGEHLEGCVRSCGRLLDYEACRMAGSTSIGTSIVTKQVAR